MQYLESDEPLLEMFIEPTKAAAEIRGDDPQGWGTADIDYLRVEMRCKEELQCTARCFLSSSSAKMTPPPPKSDLQDSLLIGHALF